MSDPQREVSRRSWRDELYESGEILARAAMMLALGVAPLLGGIALLGWQVIRWLYVGEWQPVAINDLLRGASSPPSWAWAPTEWVGVWKVLEWFPASLFGILFGGGVLLLFLFDDKA